MNKLLIVLFLVGIVGISGCIDEDITGETILKETNDTGIITTTTTTVPTTTSTTTSSSTTTTTTTSSTSTTSTTGTTTTTTSYTTTTTATYPTTTTTTTTTTSTTIQCTGTFTATVDYVYDGDTLNVVECEKSIRLALTSTPELNEPGGQEAKSFASSLCQPGSQIVIDQDSGQPYGPYGRIIALVYCQGKKLNAELLYNDLGNIYTYYCSISEFSDEDWAQEYGC